MGEENNLYPSLALFSKGMNQWQGTRGCDAVSTDLLGVNSVYLPCRDLNSQDVVDVTKSHYYYDLLRMCLLSAEVCFLVL